MLRSVAVLSDIHGVLPALEAVLVEPAVAAADRIVVTGDIAAGPQPGQVLDRLTGLGDRVTLVRGNADRELVELAGGGSIDVPDPIAPWAAAQLRPDQVALLAGLPHPVLLEVSGFGTTLFCHGTPADDEAVVLVDSRLDRWAEAWDGITGLAGLPGMAALAGSAGAVDAVQTVVCGHTHMPFVRLAHRRLVINPGSIGMPYGRVGAHWALLTDGAVQLRRSLFDVEAARAAIRAECSYPDVDEWTDYFLNARASDAEALAAFGPRDGRLADPASPS